jgi:D-alanine-D-alanine ligase
MRSTINCRIITAKILDLCCGQGRHTLHLAKSYPHIKFHGHDQSSFLISLAKERAQEQKLTSQTTFTVGDCRSIPYKDNTFDLVIVMGNSFGYFATDDGDKKVLKEVLRVLAPGGRVVLDLTDGGYMRENFAERSWEWVDDTIFVCRERQLSKDRLRLISREIVSSTDKGVIRDQFYQERLYSKSELEELLKDNGLEIALVDQKDAPEAIITLGKDMSKRKEDLGMMEQRMLIMSTKPGGVGSADSPSESQVSEDTDITLTDSLEGAEQQISKMSTYAVPSNSILYSPHKPPITDMVILLGDVSLPCIGKLNNTWNKEDYETRRCLISAMEDLGYDNDAITILDNHEAFHRVLAAKKPAFVFNLCDEGFYNDALKELHVPAILDMLEIPYSGAGPNCLAYCYDKGLVNRTADSLGISTPKEVSFLGETASPAISDLDKLHQVIEAQISYPAFIKPIKGDNSLGITGRSIVRSKADLTAYMAQLRAIGIVDVLVQEYLEGTEYGVGMVGNPNTGFHFFPILEIDFSKILEKSLPPILGFDSKWDPSSPYWTDIGYKRAVLSAEVESSLKKACITLWERFGCRDYARFDFRCDKGRGDGLDGLNGAIKLLEVNPNPGWCWDGKLAYMAKLEGVKYKDMIRMILAASWDRIQREDKEAKNAPDSLDSDETTSR